MQDFKQAAILCLFTLATADVSIYSQKSHRQIELEFRDLASTFGEPIPMDGLRAFVVYAQPANACSPLAPPPNVTNFTGRWAVLIQRYDCTFEEKVRRAQNASYDIAIVHNVNSSDLERMNANDSEGIYIPSIFVGGPTGMILKESYQFFKGFYVIIDDDSPFEFNTHLLLPFAILVGVCFITTIGFMIIKCIKDHRRARRHRLPNSSLGKIPTAKYRKGDPYETCAICLEDYVVGEKLRILPCSHAYHCGCIDPWLTRNRRVCPVCKRKVFAGDKRSRSAPSDSDSVTDDDDNTPLIHSTQQTDGGTFNVITTLENSMLRDLRFLSSFTTNGSLPCAGPSSGVGSVNQPGQEGSESSSEESDSSWYSSSIESHQQLVDSNASLVGNRGEEVDVYPRPARSPTRNDEIEANAEETNNVRPDVLI